MFIVSSFGIHHSTSFYFKTNNRKRLLAIQLHPKGWYAHLSMEGSQISGLVFLNMYVPQVIDRQTGLLSKGYFEQHELPLALLKARTNEVPLSYFLIDLDDFHDFNEDYGHVVGDEAMKQ